MLFCPPSAFASLDYSDLPYGECYCFRNHIPIADIRSISQNVIFVFLIQIPETNSKRLQANTAAVFSAIARDNHVNQNLIASVHGAVKGLVELVNSKNPVCQVKAANAIESLACGNVDVQAIIEDAGAVRPLIRLLKIWSIEVKEQGTSQNSQS